MPAGIGLQANGAFTGGMWGIIISGTPTEAFSGTVVVTLTGAGQSGSAQLTINFNIAGPPSLPISLTISPLPTSSVSGTLSRTISATGGTGAISYNVQSGSLPPGISLSGGVLSGTYSSAGSFNFTIRATDSVGATADLLLAVVVNPPVTIQTSSLPGGWVSKNVSGNVSFSGGTSPVTVQVVGGAMPTGVSLGGDGSFGGSLGAAGSFMVSIRATDAVGSFDTRS